MITMLSLRGWMALTFLGALAGGVGVQLNVALGKVRAFVKQKCGCEILVGKRDFLEDAEMFVVVVVCFC